MSFEVLQGDCIEQMANLGEASIDAIVCDPPYGIGFMGKEWDGVAIAEAAAKDRATRKSLGPESASRPGRSQPRSSSAFGNEAIIAGPVRGGIDFQLWCESWAQECLRILKPGGHLLAFGGTRTYHRLACAVEDAGFEIRDSLLWLYASGFPKSHNLDRLRGETFCGCEGEADTEHDLRPLPDSDLSAAVNTEDQPGQVLLSGVPQQGASAEGSPAPSASEGCSEPSLEGRGDDQAEQGQLRRDSSRSGTDLGAADGQGRRLHSRASTGHGKNDRAPADEDGSGSPPGSRSSEQRSKQPGALADQRLAQDGRGWQDCPRCGLPVIPHGLGTALKPAHEPIVVARKPLEGTVASNVLKYGTGAINVDGCRIGTSKAVPASPSNADSDLTYGSYGTGEGRLGTGFDAATGRWPANVVLSHTPLCEPVGTRVVKGDPRDTGSGERPGGFAGVGAESGDGEPNAPVYGDEEVVEWDCAPGCPVAALDAQSGNLKSGFMAAGTEREGIGYRGGLGSRVANDTYGDRGGASRFFYCAKTSRAEREAGISQWKGRPCECPDRQDEDRSLPKAISELGEEGGSASSTNGSGNSTTDRSQTDSKSTIGTRSRPTTESRTSNSSAPSTTNGSTPSTTAEDPTGDGNGTAPCAKSGSPRPASISTPTSEAGFSTADADPATSESSSNPSSSVSSHRCSCPVCGGVIGGALRNAHPT